MKGDTIKCAICGVLFTKNSHRHAICSDICREMAKLEKKEFRRSNYTIFARDDFRCVYYGKSPIEDGVKLTVDHIIPRFNGGEHNVFNLITACTECNFRKESRILNSGVYARIISRISRDNRGISEKSAKLIEEIFKNRYSNEDNNSG